MMKEVKNSDDLKNLQSVTFTKAVFKTICSRHSGSILAQSEPVVLLSSTNAERAREVYRLACNPSEPSGLAAIKKSTLGQSMIYNLLHSYGILSNRIPKEVVMEVVDRLYKGPAEMDEADFLCFLQTFQAPAYNFGQRLRRNAGRGELKDMTDLIIRGCDANTADGEGLTSLHYACEFNRADIITALHSLVGDILLINAKDKYGWTPLHCAIHHGSEESMKLILKLGGTVTLKDNVGKTPLHIAAAQNRASFCDALMAEGSDLNEQDENGMTPMHDAAFKGHFKLYETLLKASPPTPLDLDIRDKLGYLSSDYLGSYHFEAPPDTPAR